MRLTVGVEGPNDQFFGAFPGGIRPFSRQPVGDPHLDIESVPDPEHVLWIDPAHPA
jgi:hypothetical protein